MLHRLMAEFAYLRHFLADCVVLACSAEFDSCVQQKGSI